MPGGVPECAPIPPPPMKRPPPHKVMYNKRGSADWNAEVVLISTSLPGLIGAYWDSCRIQNFMDCKGVDYFHVDTALGQEYRDAQIITDWISKDIVFRDTTKAGSKVDLIIPQILIDGVPVGAMEDLQTLEDDNDLDYILSRESCPNCLHPRPPHAPSCPTCHVRFIELIVPERIGASTARTLGLKNQSNVFRVMRPLLGKHPSQVYHSLRNIRIIGAKVLRPISKMIPPPNPPPQIERGRLVKGPPPYPLNVPPPHGL
eukprot:GHVO01069617.1.p1 GENE.GHVO01069617.1~~GHVO01069617.1.p1  ORF type:complete len:259 (-),score=65.09 GHVO01069617.1:74-850(-)